MNMIHMYATIRESAVMLNQKVFLQIQRYFPIGDFKEGCQFVSAPLKIQLSELQKC